MALLPPLAVVNPVMYSHGMKDSRWLMLDVCREYTRNRCTRTENECRFAHPSSNIEVQNGKVICCFDSIKGRCQRHNPPCKYLHPPQHLKEQLLQTGRRNLFFRHIQSQFFVNGMQRVLPVHQFPAQNGARFGTFYSPTYTSFPSILPGAAPDTCGSAVHEMMTENCQMDAMNGSPGAAAAADGENAVPISNSQNQHQLELWSGATTPPSSMVAVDSNGYITSYCSPVYSPVYFQRACGIPGMMPMVKTDAVPDTKYEVPVYQPTPPVLNYPQMMLSSSLSYQTPYYPIMIPGNVSSAMPRY